MMSTQSICISQYADECILLQKIYNVNRPDTVSCHQVRIGHPVTGCVSSHLLSPVTHT